MIHLFQIGNVSLHLHKETWHGYILEGDAGFGAAFRARSEFVGSDQYIHNPVTVTIESKMYPNRNFTVDQQIQRLRSIRGAPMPIIGYVMDSTRETQCACQESGNCTLIWLTTHGILKKVEADQEEMNGALRLTLEIELYPYWQPLNRYLWSWQSSDINYISPPPAPSTYLETMKMYPDCNFLTHTIDNMRWARRVIDDLDLYDPDLWVLLGENKGQEYPTFCNASDWTTTPDHSVYIENSLWGAPPLSIYAFDFTNSGGSGLTTAVFTMTITRENGVQQIVDTVSFNYGQTTENLDDAGYSSLLEEEGIAYLGDLFKKPGFIVINGEDVNVRPAATYTGMWPGMLGPGLNTISFDFSTVTNVAVSWLHLYRRF